MGPGIHLTQRIWRGAISWKLRRREGLDQGRGGGVHTKGKCKCELWKICIFYRKLARIMPTIFCLKGLQACEATLDWRTNIGVNSMDQDPLAEDSMTNDFYFKILCVEQP